jgi:hypothetical protein
MVEEMKNFIPLSRVARWFIFKPKIPIFVYFVRTWVEKIGIFLGRLVFYYHFGILYGYFGIFCPCGCIIFHFGLLYQEKSVNPAPVHCRSRIKKP